MKRNLFIPEANEILYTLDYIFFMTIVYTYTFTLFLNSSAYEGTLMNISWLPPNGFPILALVS